MRNTSWSNNNWPQDFSDVVEPKVSDIFEHVEGGRRTFREVVKDRWSDFCRMDAAAFVGWSIVCWFTGAVTVTVAMGLRWLAVVLVLIVCGPHVAMAEGGDSRAYVRKSLWSSCEFWGTCYRYRYHSYDERWQRVRVIYRHAPVRHYREATLHYRTPDRRYDRDEGPRCRESYRTVGNQHVAVQGAKAEADKAWIQAIRFHLGEKFMDIQNAKRISYTCSRSSVGETLGQTFSRCEIQATPCKAEREDGER